MKKEKNIYITYVMTDPPNIAVNMNTTEGNADVPMKTKQFTEALEKKNIELLIALNILNMDIVNTPTVENTNDTCQDIKMKIVPNVKKKNNSGKIRIKFLT